MGFLMRSSRMKIRKESRFKIQFFITSILLLVLVFGVNGQALAGLDLEVPIDMVDHGFLAPSDGAGTTNFNRSRIFLDANDYDGSTVNYYFEIVAMNTDTVARNVYFRRTTNTATNHATISVPAGASSFTRYRVAFTIAPLAGKNNYLVRLTDTNVGKQLIVSAARVIVQQINATKTRIQIPLVQKNHDLSATGSGRADTSTSTVYTQGDADKYSLWKKVSGQYADISGWTLEAVLDNDSATGTTYAALHRASDGEIVADSEVSLYGDVIALVDKSFTDGAPNFTDDDKFELKIKTSSGTGVKAHLGRASLYVSLTNLSRAEVLYRVSRKVPSGPEDVVEQRTLLDTSLFTSPTVYLEATGRCADTTPLVFLRDHDSNPSGTGGADVSGSEITFSVNRDIVRTGAITPDSGDNFYTRVGTNTNTLKVTHAWIVVTSEIPTGIVNESFEATGAYGYDEAGWTEVIDAGCTLDENAAPIPGTPPTDLGGECFKTIVLNTTSNDSYAYQTKTGQNISYVQGYLYLDEEGLNDGQLLVTLGLYDASQLRVAAVEIGQSGGQVALRLSYWSNGVLNYTGLLAIALDTWYEVEFKYDVTNLLWEIRINGVTKASGPLVAPIRTPSTLLVGVLGYQGTGGQATLCTDLAAWDDSDWPEPTVCPMPGEPSGPDPGSGISGVSVNADLDWADSSDTDSYDVYFGTDPSPPLYAEAVTESNLTLPTLEYCTHYYWGVVAKNACGNYNEGVVWDFTTENGPPGTPGSPDPADLETGVSAYAVLDWSDCTSTDTYDVYLDESNPPTTKVASDISVSNFDPNLNWSTQYYWQVVAKNSCGSSTSSSVWTFTTGPQPVADHFVWSDSPSPGIPYDTWDTAAHKVQEAINACTGSTIMVRAGTTYSEKITMKDGVDLVAEEGVTPTITYSPGMDHGVVEFVGPMTCNLTGITIQYTGMGHGIFMNGSSGQINATIDNCTVRNGDNYGLGIRLTGSLAVTITGCEIYNNPGIMRTGIGTRGWGTGDRIASGSSITIKGTTIGGSGQGLSTCGIRLRGSGGGNIQLTIGGSGVGDANTISHNGRAGIVLTDIDQVIIVNNDISYNGTYGTGGILLVDTSTVSPHITNNAIHHHVNAAGINIGGASNITIGDNNNIYGNHTGIAFYVANNDNLYGGQLDPITKTVSSQPVTITENNIFSNTYAGIAVRDGITGAVTITQNNIHSNTRGGIRMQRRCNLNISRNTIRDNLRGGIHTGSDAPDGGGFIAGQIGEAVLTIEKNKIHENGQATMGAGIDVRHASGTIYNNLVYGNHRGGIRFGDYITEIVNNTVVNNGTADSGGGIVYDDLAGAVNDPPAGVPPAPLFITNNISAYNKKAGIRACFDNTPGFEERDYNLVYLNNGRTDDCGWYTLGGVSYVDNLRCANMQYGGCGAHRPSPLEMDDPHDIIADPLFKDMPGHDYRLQRVSEGDANDSPAINAGDDGYDMGAHGGYDPIDW
jgi:hypothetical protein